MKTEPKTQKYLDVCSLPPLKRERKPLPKQPPLDLDALMVQGHELWLKGCPTFDWPDVLCQSLTILHRDKAGTTWKTVVCLYDGAISKSKPRALDLSNGWLVEDPAAEAQRLAKRGYSRCIRVTPEPEPLKRKPGRPRTRKV